MEMIGDVFAGDTQLRELIMPEITPQEMIERDRAAAKARFGEMYPNAKFGDYFLLTYKRALRDDAPCVNCKGYPCAKKNGTAGYFGLVYFNEQYQDMAIKYVMCDFKKQFDMKKKIAAQFARAQIPKLYLNKTFEDYKVDAANENAVNWAKYILKNPKSLYLYGAPGVGKTFLAAILAQEFLKRGKAVIFSDVPYLLTQMRKTFGDNSKENIEDLLNTLAQVEALVLDDIGTENATQWAIEQMYLIINSRYNQNKFTILTSNYNLNELAGRLNFPVNGKPGVTGDRIARRLKAMCGVAEIGEGRR